MSSNKERKYLANLDTPTGDLQYEIERLLTFQDNFSSEKTSVELSENGYYYDHFTRKIICYFCKIVLEPSESTFKHCHSCRHQVDSFPIYVYEDNDKENVAASSNQENAVAASLASASASELSNTSIHPNDLLSERLKTFSLWPKDRKPNPEVLAKAGFYYNGISDTAICSSCSCILKNWKCDDDPLKKHSEQFPNCDFIQYMREATMTENIDVSSKASENSSADLRNSTEVLPEDDLIAENYELKHDMLCKMCMTQEITALFTPCGHLITCIECGSALSKCPRCHTLIYGLVKVIFS